MRGVGGELLLLGKGGFESGKSGIQNGGKLAKFTFGLGHVDALRQVPGGNFRGGGADVCNRTDGAPDQPPAAHKAEK